VKKERRDWSVSSSSRIHFELHRKVTSKSQYRLVLRMMYTMTELKVAHYTATHRRRLFRGNIDKYQLSEPPNPLPNLHFVNNINLLHPNSALTQNNSKKRINTKTTSTTSAPTLANLTTSNSCEPIPNNTSSPYKYIATPTPHKRLGHRCKGQASPYHWV
jgi:hypothetical protein